MAREVARWIRYRRGPQRVGGPVSVARSLRLGLQRAGIPFRSNVAVDRMTPLVGVLSHVDTLRLALALKRAGRIERLVAGPNLVVVPSHHGGILLSPEIDRVIVPSEWVRDVYVTYDSGLGDRIVVWPAGVDERTWCPAGERTREALVYVKDAPQDVTSVVLTALQAAGADPVVLRYGGHNAAQYLAALRACHWAVFLSTSESQGLALLEAWACDVPTLVWDPRPEVVHNGSAIRLSSAPYLTRETGRRFERVEDLPEAIAEMRSGRISPREHVLAHWTAEAAARRYAASFD